MVQLKKILVGYDGSGFAKNALDYAIYLCQKTAAEMTLIYVVPMEMAGKAMMVKPTYSKGERLFGEEMMKEGKEAAETAGIKATTRVEMGHIAGTIMELAEKEKFDLIIMGSRGRSEVKEIVLGSVSGAVMHHAKVPVLVVR